jgi:hypothetical protein
MIQLRTTAVLGIFALLTACSSSKAAHAKKMQQAREAAINAAAQEAARPRPAVAQYVQAATVRFGQEWQRFLDQYGERLTPGSSVVAITVVTVDGQPAALRFEKPTPDADMLQRGIEVTLSSMQFNPFPDEMLRELGLVKTVELRFPVTVP